MKGGGLREEKCGGGYSSSWEGRARSFSSGGGETGLWREGEGIFADGKGAICGKRVRGGGYSSSWDRRRVRSFFSRRETWTWVMERRAAVFA